MGSNESHQITEDPNVTWETLSPSDILCIGEKRREDDKYLRFVCLSDTHGGHSQIEIPMGDVLLITGDFTRWKSSKQDLEDFNSFLGKLPHKYKVLICGNHEMCITPKNIDKTSVLLSNCTHYLEDSFIEIEGIKIYGSPWHIKRGLLKRANAFGLDASQIYKKWDKIPTDTNILLTHYPPDGIPNTEPGDGCPYLLKTVTQTIKPQVHVFGHDHGSYGIYRGKTGDGEVTFINAANTINPGNLRDPIVFDMVIHHDEKEEV